MAEQQPDWTTALTKLMVRRHDYYTLDTALVELEPLEVAPKHRRIALRVPREALAHPMLELGAVWTLTPGLREPTYRERIAAAQAALDEAGGDLRAITPEQRDLLEFEGQPF